MQTIFYIILSIVIGVIISIYLPLNSSVSKYLGSPITANISFFLAALLVSIAIFAFFGDYRTLYNAKNVPIYLYFTGAVAALIILGTTFVIPRIGARRYFILVIAGQTFMAIIISHFGLFESPKDVITLKKITGAVLLIAGAAISI